MGHLLSIGDFARATHLSVKSLRYYQQEGLLAPADVDAISGYRRYDLDQIATAQVIRRFRALEMPVGDIRRILTAPDVETRNALIATHLGRMEGELEKTQRAVASLRELLEHPAAGVPIEHRRVPAVWAAAISHEVDIAEVGAWHQGALGELFASLDAQHLEPAGSPGGIYEGSLFTSERGRATVFVPVSGAVTAVGRVVELEIPAIELAMVAHLGPADGIDRAYGALADYVTRHAFAVDGPIREYYPVNRHNTDDSDRWRTEIGWPIFETAGSTRRRGLS